MPCSPSHSLTCAVSQFTAQHRVGVSLSCVPISSSNDQHQPLSEHAAMYTVHIQAHNRRILTREQALPYCKVRKKCMEPLAPRLKREESEYFFSNLSNNEKTRLRLQNFDRSLDDFNQNICKPSHEYFHIFPFSEVSFRPCNNNFSKLTLYIQHSIINGF